MAELRELANVGDVEQAWRTLKPAEKDRAEYWLGAASRRLRRRWKDLDSRIDSGQLNRHDVTDVVVQLVIGALPSLDNAGMKSLSVQAGSMTRSYTLEDRRNQDRLHLEDWMVEIFDGVAAPTATPKIAAPRPYNLNRVFPQWQEVYDE